MDTTSIAALSLLLISLVLFALEMFIPSAGLITTLAVISLVGSIIFAAQAWWSASQPLFWTFIGSIIVLVPGAVFGAVQLLPYLPWADRIMLEPPAEGESASFRDERAHLGDLVGRVGVTITVLNPGGMVDIDGERLHCEGEGMMLDIGQHVEVVAVKGNRVQVRSTDRPLDSERTVAAETDDAAVPTSETTPEIASEIVSEVETGVETEDASGDEQPLDFPDFEG